MAAEIFKRYSLGEEIANAVTHGLGAVLSVAGLVFLIIKAATYGGARQIIAFSIYGGTLILLFTFSTLYHSLTHQGAKRVFRIFDHTAIYLLIAGTYTPFLLLHFRSLFGWSFLIGIWLLALAGILFEAFFIGRFRKISTLLYILLGLLSVILFKDLFAKIPVGGIVWLVIGGVSYIFGVIFYAWRKLRYGHAIWHIFVLGGSVAHYIAIFQYLIPIR